MTLVTHSTRYIYNIALCITVVMNDYYLQIMLIIGRHSVVNGELSSELADQFNWLIFDNNTR